MVDTWQGDMAAFFEELAADDRRRAELARLAAERAKLAEAQAEAHRQEAESFLRDVVGPLLVEIAAEFSKYGRTLSTTGEGLQRTTVITHAGQEEFRYELTLTLKPVSIWIESATPLLQRPDGTWYMGRGMIRKSIAKVTAEDIARDFLAKYKAHIQARRAETLARP